MHYKSLKRPGGKLKTKIKECGVRLFHPGMDIESMKRSIVNCLRYEESKDEETAIEEDYLHSLAWSIKHRLVDRWIETQKHYHHSDAKQVYYLSLEYLTGQSMKKNMINLGVYEVCQQAMSDLGLNLDEICEFERDAALGNGGLGRLAACYLDSMATIGLPAHGYGLRYEYGIFKQLIENGDQVELPDNWLKEGSIWEIRRPEHVHEVHFKGQVKAKTREDGSTYYKWSDTDVVLAEAYDTPYIGYGTNNVNSLRLWSAEPAKGFNLESFSSGNYLKSVEDLALSKTITRVLYPNDSIEKGVELRLFQEYFLVSATLQDILSHFKFKNKDFNDFPNKVAIQLNDTHPSLAIPELMRLLMDNEGLGWDHAWKICQKTFAYTNHTVLPEALERWDIGLLEENLPRHMQIIYEINSHFLREAANHHQNDKELLKRISIIEEDEDGKRVNMANLSIVGSHKVNGVSALHTQILKDDIFKDFNEIFPDRIINKTNGVTPRRWLIQCNTKLAKLIESKIGSSFLHDLNDLRKVEEFIQDEKFLEEWHAVKRYNKERLAKYIKQEMDIEINPDMMFDIQVKRIHQYKRQLLNLFHVVAQYIKIKKEPNGDYVPRCIIFGGKAAPSYTIAKSIIKLINMVSYVINADPELDKLLKVVFIPDYKVSSAEKIIPAADLSEQISTAGYEASGTSNMKFALNGSLTIGTLDGANVEMLEEIGEENMFIFGKKADEISQLKKDGYSPTEEIEKNPLLKEVVELISNGHFNLEQPEEFKPLMDLVREEDSYCITKDFDAYIQCQSKVDELYKDQKAWTTKSVLNSVRMGKFSSDRCIREYADEIWDVKSLKVPDIEYDKPNTAKNPNASNPEEGGHPNDTNNRPESGL
ncbi:MAG: Maltodextrin phosphorylase [Chlamydiae bacterium]|nr:Maltodextrin phosphorylase [Chlamydiota bacterium]